jgi:hypothetical protein
LRFYKENIPSFHTEVKNGIIDYYCSLVFGAEARSGGALPPFHNYKGNEDIRYRSNILFPDDIVQSVQHIRHHSCNNERLQSVPA